MTARATSDVSQRKKQRYEVIKSIGDSRIEIIANPGEQENKKAPE
jgi:hypothetical protein